MRVYLLSGPIASGKGVLTECICDLHGGGENVEIFVLSDILRGEAKRRGLPINRDTLETLGKELRTDYGPGILGKIVISNMKRALADNRIVGRYPIC